MVVLENYINHDVVSVTESNVNRFLYSLIMK